MRDRFNYSLILFLISTSVSCGVHKETKHIYKKDGSLYATETNISVLVKTKRINEFELVVYETPKADLFFEKGDILRMITNSAEKAKYDSLISKNHIISLNPDFSLNGLTQKINVHDLISLIRKGKVRIQIKQNKSFVTFFRFEEKTINKSICVCIKDEYGVTIFEYKGCSYPIVEYP